MIKKTLLAVALSSAISNFAYSAPLEKPNILIIIADDMGYSDISPFGGEIPTPNLQTMAEQGVRMSQYYTSPMSAPARSMLLTGATNQQAGIGGMWWYENTVGEPGYELRLTDRVVTMAERFQDAGYNTLMSGKWHLGYSSGSKPTDRGFNQAFAFMGGGTSHFDDAVPLGTVESFHTYYTLNGKKTALPANFYSSEAYAQQLEKWIKETPSEQPIFAYLAFTAPHDPLQAPDDWTQRFDGQYDEGYGKIYRQRINRLKEIGIITDKTPMPHLDLDKEWEQLTPEEKRYAAKTMQVYAAMIANMDEQIGNVFQTLKETGRDKNTIIIFATDNGANPAQGFYYEGDPAFWTQFDNSYENLGRKNSFISAGPHWANVSNAPYVNYHKTTSAQGGINTNFIIKGLGIHKAGSIDNTPMAVYDIAPTLYEFANIDPNKKIKNINPVPIRGVSFKQHFTQDIPVKTRYSFAMELHNQAALVEGDWKLRRLVPNSAKAEMAPWELFNLKNDPLETQNVATQHPKILEKLRQQYEQFAKTGMVIEAKGEAIDYIGYDEKTGNYIGIDPKTHKRIIPSVNQSGE